MGSECVTTLLLRRHDLAGTSSQAIMTAASVIGHARRLSTYSQQGHALFAASVGVSVRRHVPDRFWRVRPKMLAEFRGGQALLRHGFADRHSPMVPANGCGKKSKNNRFGRVRQKCSEHC